MIKVNIKTWYKNQTIKVASEKDILSVVDELNFILHNEYKLFEKMKKTYIDAGITLEKETNK
jgi:hypothetical protein|tara:strand:+ start:1783 stop:1968 length:186 start_codon:yes stop_codon:yes gene_type:complete